MSGPVRLLETMRSDGGRGVEAIALWPLHRARLAASARAFRVPLRLDAVERAVAEALPDGPVRVRLTVGMDGGAVVETGPLEAAPFRTAWVDSEPFGEVGGRYCIHKTTRRAHYEARRARALARGADEAVLVGPGGRLVEGTRTTVWVELGGRLLTPPLSAGGLPGVMRGHLLDTRRDTAEVDLRLNDLLGADRVWLSNAVVGLVPVLVLPA